MELTLSRRTFVRTGALAAAAYATASASPAAAQSHDALSSVRLGLCSYDFRNFDRAQLIGYMKQLNVFALNAKDVKDHLPMDPAAEAKALDDYHAAGIRLHAAGTIYFPKDEDDDIRSKFEYCKRAGIKVIVAGDPTPNTLPRIEKFVKEYDIRFAIHNHGPEDKNFPTPQSVLDAIKNMDPRMGLCMDIGHSVRAGADPVEWIDKAGARLFELHTKDLRDLKGPKDQPAFSQCPVGDGAMPIVAIFKRLKKVGFQGTSSLEYEIDADDPMPGMQKSFAYMRGVLAGLKA